MSSEKTEEENNLPQNSSEIKEKTINESPKDSKEQAKSTSKNDSNDNSGKGENTNDSEKKSKNESSKEKGKNSNDSKNEKKGKDESSKEKGKKSNDKGNKKKTEDPLSEIAENSPLGLNNDSDNKKKDKKDKKKDNKSEKFFFYFTFSNKKYLDLDGNEFGVFRNEKPVNFKIINKKKISNNSGNYIFLIIRGEILNPQNEKLEFYFEPNEHSCYGCFININPKQNFIFGNLVDRLKNRYDRYSDYLSQLQLYYEDEFKIFYESLKTNKELNEKEQTDMINNLFSCYNSMKNKEINISRLIPMLSLFQQSSKIPLFLLNNSIKYTLMLNGEVIEPKLFIDLLNLVEQSNMKDKEKKDGLIRTLSDIFVTYYYKYNIGTFIDLINEKNKYFIIGLIQLINQKKINIQELFKIERLDKSTVIEYLIDGATKKDEIEEIFNFSSSLKTTLELIDKFYGKLYLKLTRKEKTNFFGSIINYFSGPNYTLSINYPTLKKDDDIKEIFDLHKKIIEREKSINKEKN